MADINLGDPIPRGTLPALIDDTIEQVAPMIEDPGTSQTRHDLIATGWNLAFVPLLTWSSLMTASWAMWSNFMQAGSEA